MTSRGTLASLAVLSALLTGCGRSQQAPAPASDVRTIQQPGNIPIATETSDMLSASASSSQPPLVDLPFSPAISMDPVDGGKVSIRPETPVFEYKGRLYYFRSEESKMIFVRNPDKYATGPLGRY